MAVQMAAWALDLVALDRGTPLRVLEPSAGEGHLIEALFTVEASLAQVEGRPIRPIEVTAVELHRGRAAILRERFPQITVVNRCFVSWWEDEHEEAWTPERERPFHLAITNPPYDDGQDGEHMDPTTRLAVRTVALVRSAFKHGTTERARFWDEVRLRREAVLKGRPSFIDRENGKEGTARHEFSVLDVERPMHGWRRKPGEADAVRTEWWA